MQGEEIGKKERGRPRKTWKRKCVLQLKQKQRNMNLKFEKILGIKPELNTERYKSFLDYVRQ